MAIKLNERTLALLAARSVPNQLTYLAMTVKLNERTLALLVARSSSKYSVYILTLKTAFSARICTEYLNRRRQMLFLLSFTFIFFFPDGLPAGCPVRLIKIQTPYPATPNLHRAA